LFFFRSFFTDVSDRFASVADVKQSSGEVSLSADPAPSSLVTSPKHIVNGVNGAPVMSVGNEVMSNMHSLPNHNTDPEEMLLIFSEIAEAASARRSDTDDSSDGETAQNAAVQAPVFFKLVVCFIFFFACFLVRFLMNLLFF
jgi:hypothetical protein